MMTLALTATVFSSPRWTPGLALPAPAQAAASSGVAARVVVAAPGWHKIGTYDISTCFGKANYYHDHYGTLAERCDPVGGGWYEF